MTHPGGARNALEALLAASREAPREMHRSARDQSTVAAFDRRPTTALDRPAVALLARLLAYRDSAGPQVIQLSVCVAGAQAVMVTAPLARACSVLVGRTLHVSMDERCRVVTPQNIDAGPLPDAFLPRLYHTHVGPTDYDLLYGPARAEALAALARPFRFLVIDTSGCCPATALTVAALCTCTVLVVEAGVTPLAAIRATASSTALAGGRVVGTVLSATSRNPHARPSP